MKKFVANTVKILLTGLLLLGLYSCDDMMKVGLGDPVDVTKPVISITSPAKNESLYFNEDFQISGTVEDDIKVAKVTVYWDDDSGSVNATVNGNEWTASIPFDRIDSRNNVLFTAYAYDTDGKQSEPSYCTVYIDDKGPTILVKAPQYNTVDIIEKSTYIVIEGQSWDYSPVMSVEVEFFAVNDTSKTLFPALQAEGTSSWTIQVPLSTFSDESDFIYRVIATDKAGNTNNYMYHIDDFHKIVKDLKDADELKNPDDYIFPAISEIGYWDQDGTDLKIYKTDDSPVFTVDDPDITADDGTTIREQLQISMTPDENVLRFRNDTNIDKPNISLSNLDKDSAGDTNAIGVGVPIYASATDDKDGIDASSIQLKIYESGAATPSYTVTASNFNAPGNGLYASFQFDLKGANTLKPGTYDGEITLKDKRGTDSKQCKFAFLVDQGAPSILEINPNSSYASVSGGNIKLGIIVQDDNEGFTPDSLNATIYDITSGLPGTEITGVVKTLVKEDPVIINSEVFYKCEYALSIPAGTTQKIQAKISIQDKTGIMVNAVRDYTIDTSSPTLVVNNPTSAPIIGTSFTADGTAVDLGGSAVSKIEVALVEGHLTTPPADLAWETAENTDNWFKKYVISGFAEGNLTFFARPYDFAGNIGSFEYVNFSFDIAEPELTATNEPPKYVTSDFTFDGTLTDSNGLESIDIKVSKNDGTAISVSGYPKTLSGAKTFNWSTDILVPADGSADAEYEYTIIAKDISGRDARTLTKTVIVDATNPAFTFNTPSINDKQVNGLISVSGATSDTAGITSLSLYIKEETAPSFTKLAEITPATATNTFDNNGSNPSTVTSWSKNIDSSPFADGRYIAEIRATDKAGNTGTAQCSWNFDQSTDLPYFEFYTMDINGSAIDNGVANTSTLLGRVKDDDGVDPGSIEINIDGGGWNPITKTTGTGTEVNWSQSLASLGTGPHVAEFRVNDVNGISAESVLYGVSNPVLNFTIDAGPPEVTVNSFAWGSTTITDPSKLEERILINEEPTINVTATDTVQINTLGYIINSGSEQTVTIPPAASVTRDITIPLVNLIADQKNAIEIIAYDSAGQPNTAQILITLDATKPVIAVSSLSSTSQAGTIAIKGTLTEDAPTALEYQLVSAGDPDPANWISTPKADFPFDLNTTGYAEGTYTMYLRAEDEAGNESNASDAAALDYGAGEQLTLKIDQTDPEATMSLSGTANIKNGVDRRNTAFTLSGLADDATTTAERAAKTVTLSITKDGSAVPGSPFTITPDSTTANFGKWSYSQTVDSGHTDDGLYEYMLTVTDDADKVVNASKTVRIDTTAPTIAVAAPVENEASTNASYTVTGTASDLGAGIDASSFTYALDGGASGTVSLSGANWTVPTLALGTQGAKKLTINGADELGTAISPIVVNFYYDAANPTVTEATIGAGGILTNTDFNIGGLAKDTNKLKQIVITAEKSDGTVLAKTWTVPLSASNADESWTENIAAADLDGDDIYTFTVKVEDIAGKTAQLQRTVTLDTSAPTVTAAAPAGSYVAEIFGVNGTATDGNGLSSVEYNSGTGWNSISTASSWYKELNFTGNEGSHTIHFRATDLAGNTTIAADYAEITVNVDQAAPQATLILNGTANIKNGIDRRDSAFTISGIADDAAVTTGRSASSVELTITKDGTPITGSPFTITPDPVNGSWSRNQIVDGTTDGLYEYTLNVQDAAAKTASASQIVRIDTTAPTVAITAPVTGEASSMPTYTFTGTATDLGVGIDPASLTYSLSGGASGTVSLSGASWSVANVVLGSEGAKTLTIEGADELGNTITPVAVNFYYDAANPTITETTVGTGGKLARTDFDLGGSAGDTNALSQIIISAERSGDAGWSKTWPAAVAASWSHTIPTVDLAGDDTYVFTITVKDIAGKTAQLQRTVTLDTSAPTVTAAAPAGSYVAETFGLNGTATDSNGLQSVEYEIDSSGTWQSVNVATNWYKDFNFTGDEGNHTIRFRATDIAGNTTDAADYASITVNVDASAPSLTIDPPEPGKSWGDNYFVTTGLSITATAGDTNGGATITSSEGSVAGSTVTVPAKTTAGIYTVTITATDSVGRTTSETISYSFDETAPSLSGISLSDGDSIGTSSLTITGTASDAESGIEKVEYKLNTDPFKNANGTESWNVQLTGLNDELNQTIQFRTTDLAGRTTTGSVITFHVDTSAPEIASDIYVDQEAPYTFTADGNTSKLQTPFVLGAANTTLALKVHVKDNISNNIDTVRVTIPGVAGSPISFTQNGTEVIGPDTYEVWETAEIDTASITEGISEWEIVATDKAGYSSIPAIRSIQMDKTGPTISKLTPQDSDILNGEVTIKGTAADNANGSGLSSISYKIGKTGAPTSWQPAGGSAYSWSIAFEDPNLINNYAHPDYATDANSDNIWDLPIQIQGLDNAGNTTTETISLQVDPDGDKPTIDIIYPDPDEANRVMGGTIRLFGSAIDDDGVKEIRILLDANANGSYDAGDIDSQGVDWYNGGLGQKANGTASWNMIINQNGEFNPAGSGLNEIKFSVRAIDIYDKEGVWSADQIIQVDKNVPKFSQATFTNGTASIPYVAGMYLKDSWNMVVEVTDDGNISSTNVTGNTGPVVESAIANGVELTIPIATPAGTGPLNITVEATDLDGKTSKMSYSVNYDNEDPTLASYSITKIEQNNKLFELTSSVDEAGSGFNYLGYYFIRRGANARVIVPAGSYGSKASPAPNEVLGSLNAPSADDPFYGIELTGGVIAASGSDYTFTQADISSNTLARVGNLIKIDGLFYKIAAVSGNSITIKNAALNTSTTTAKLIYANIVDNTIAESPEWDGSNNLTGITNDDGDELIESVYRYGTNYEWSASINSHAIPDGPVELHIVAFDKAGNFITQQVDTKVENNGPKLAKVTLGTDIDSNGTINAGETADPFSLLDGDDKEQSTVNASHVDFTAKDKTEILLEIVGGNGELQYTLDSGSRIHNLTQLRADEASAVQAIQVSTTDFATIGESANSADKKDLVITIWDTTEETAVGSTSLSAELTLPLIVDVVDGNAPMAVISPFYWNAEDDNSLYQNDRTQGHIEISGKQDGSDPDVSGHVSVRGTAFDDQRIDAIYMLIDGMTMSGTTATYHTETYTQVATYSAGTWTGKNGTGWTFTATDVSIDQNGHHIEWQLDWDSSEIANIAELNRNIKMVTIDKGSNPSSATSSGSIADAVSHNDPVYTVDVVPYVTEIVTDLSKYYPAAPSVFSRTASGKYTVMENADFEIKGFNLGGTATTVAINGTALTTPTVIDAKTHISVNAGAAADSGELAVSVNTVSALNNTSDNSLDANKQPNNINNNLLTDDIYIDLYEFKTVATPIGGTITEPTMKVSPTGKIGFSFSNALFYFSMPGYANGATSTLSHTPFDKGWEGFTRNTFAWDANDNTFGLALCPDTGGETGQSANMSFYVNEAGNAIPDMHVDDVYGRPEWAGTGTAQSGNNKNRIEHTSVSLDAADSNWIIDAERFWSPELTTTVDGTNTNIYIAYYDQATQQIRYRYGQYSNNNSNATSETYHSRISGSLPDLGTSLGGDTTDGRGFQITKPEDAATGNIQVVASAGVSGAATRYSSATVKTPGKYVALAIDESGANDVALIAWYDKTSRNLYYSYNDDPSNLAGSGAQWQTNAIQIDSANTGGWYVDMTVDSDGGVHLAYYSYATQDLKYAYLSAYNDTTADIASVDSYMSVGTHCTIDVAKDGTNQVPYISYYMIANTGTSASVRTAYRTDFSDNNDFDGADVNGLYTGKWEIATVPTENTPISDRVSIGVYENAGSITAIPTGTDDMSLMPGGNNTTHPVGNSAQVYGNGTINPVVAYACDEDGILEMAQKK